MSKAEDVVVHIEHGGDATTARKMVEDSLAILHSFGQYAKDPACRFCKKSGSHDRDCLFLRAKTLLRSMKAVEFRVVETPQQELPGTQ